MNFRKHLVATLMMVALVVVAIGCGSGDRGEQVAELESDRQQLSRSAETAARNLTTQLEAAREANRELNLQVRMQDQQLNSMQAEINRLSEATGMSRSFDERRAQDTRSDGPSFWIYFFLLILLIVIIVIVYRLLKPKPFEDDEDDDFSSFDDDFGFDEEEDDFGDEEPEDDKK